MFRPPVVRPADAPVPSAPPLPPNYAAPTMSSALASPSRPSPASIAGSSPVHYPDLSAETVPMVSLIHGAGTSSFSPASSPTKADPVLDLDLPPSYAAGGAPPPAAFALRWFPASLVIGAALSFWFVAINVTIFSVDLDTTSHYNHDSGDFFSSGSERAFAGVFAALFFLSAMFDLTWHFSYRTSVLWEVAFFRLLGMSGGGIDTRTAFFSPSLFMVVCLVSRMMTLTMFRQAMGRRVAPN
ncbi:hypothetical protein GGF32_005498 [Allomyces javanicus]|nr:hypothetical protein GGF32_005498 [Allomyces javanicus]